MLFPVLILALLIVCPGCVTSPTERYSPKRETAERQQEQILPDDGVSGGEPSSSPSSPGEAVSHARGTSTGSDPSTESSSKAVSEEEKPEASTGEAQRAVVPTRGIPTERLRELIRPSVPERFLFVGSPEYRPLTVYRDLDDNGLEDVFLLLMEVPEGGDLSSDLPVRFGSIPETAITDMSRLFSEAYAFYLAVFLRTPDGFVSMYRIPLGRWSVFEGFRGLRIDVDRPMPFAVRISFQTQEGGESLLVAFSRYNNFSFFSLKASISVSNETRDIDGDGLLDIVEWRRVFEEGTGYETFLTWFKWDGTKFSQRDSTNIVRNLNSFLRRLGRQLSGETWVESVKKNVLSPEDVSQLEDRFSDAELFERLFSPLSSDIPDEKMSFPDTPDTPDTSDTSSSPNKNGQVVEEADLSRLLEAGGRVFSNVVFPRVWENPFTTYEQERGNGYGTRFSIRFILRDGRSFVRMCKVRMNGNPFEDPQFFLEVLSR